jgi:hypothetical protein
LGIAVVKSPIFSPGRSGDPSPPVRSENALPHECDLDMQTHVVTAQRAINYQNIFLRALLNTRPLSEKSSAWRRWNSRFAMRIAIEKNRCD